MSLLVWDFMILYLLVWDFMILYLLVWECQEIEISTCIGMSAGMETGIYFSGGVCRMMSTCPRFPDIEISTCHRESVVVMIIF